MFHSDSSEVGGRVVSISDHASRAYNLALNRTIGSGRPLPLLPRLNEAARLIHERWSAFAEISRRGNPLPEEGKWLIENLRFLETHVNGIRKILSELQRTPLPLVKDGPLFGYPRVFEVAREALLAREERLTFDAVATFVHDYQTIAPLDLAELWVFEVMARLAILEELGSAPVGAIPGLVIALKELSSQSWQDFVEAQAHVESILREDPAGVHARQDFETRDRYRQAVQGIARLSNASEGEVARAAITLAQEAARKSGPRTREAHVGYHLVDDGASRLKAGLQYRPSPAGRVREFMKTWPTSYYLIGIELVTLALAAYLLSFLPEHLSWVGLILFLLATEPAIAVLNALTVAMLPPRRLPKLDFSEAIPEDCATLVVVPTLLLSEKFIDGLLNDLEVRFLANRDPQLTFALLSDLPDAGASADEDEVLVERCAAGIRALNERYHEEGRAPFYLFHRRREWNPKQNAWMGWERKRGKLIALNSLLLGQGDAFHTKVGDLALLPRVRYVITLDSDTELPRDSAAALVGTLAHPLNRAVIDERTNTVLKGYGILQPRVGISVASARRSRLASIYSGQTGFDIYTTAVSDIYQDLFGEGSYVGKGIYDVDVFQRTLARRFPHDVLLSHDLIEGAYARAGLVSDIEMIDDYPSHYTAWSKRKHRWVRGDWQIMQWLLPSVPDYHGKRAPNPLSVISLWKILDNLRRSLIEIAIFVLLMAGWTFMPGGAKYWTVVVTVVSFLPVYIGTAFSLARTPTTGRPWVHLREAAMGFLNGHGDVALRLIFLAHQTCLMVDAILRSIVRTTVTGRRLLEWESAAQAEIGAKRNFLSINTYVWLASPVAAFAAVLVWRTHPGSLSVASPYLIAWFLSPFVALWLNESLLQPKDGVGAADRVFLRGVALRTWQYFADFCGEGHCWLIPDNVHEDGMIAAKRVSPTNLGLLLNAQLAAKDFGYLSQTGLVQASLLTFATLDKLDRWRGHFLNWYSTETLEVLSPRYVSTVDSGNMAACLIVMRQGLLEQVKCPVIEKSLIRAVADHGYALEQAGSRHSDLVAAEAEPVSIVEWKEWIARKRAAVQAVLDRGGSAEAQFWAHRLAAILDGRAEELETLFPGEMARSFDRAPLLGELPALYDGILTGEVSPAAGCARERAVYLLRQLNSMAYRASELVREMDFSFLLHSGRKLFCVGFDADVGTADQYQYDLLASEARIASFIAIAKSDIPQTNWLRLSRSLIRSGKDKVLLSWTGTMFEYLMPMLWMRVYPGTLLDKSARGAVNCQRAYGRHHGVPWGISESASSEREDGSEYRYYAFGVPELALKSGQDRHLVIAPYASVLALMVDRKHAVDNLRAQAARGWLSRYGFYEAADFTQSREETLARSFMAHHQGMSLLALDNVLNHDAMQNRFHLEPIIQSTELLLHERVAKSVRVEGAPAPPSILPRTSVAANESAA